MTTLKKRIALPFVAIAAAGLVFAAVASAHSLTASKAQKSAQAYGNAKVKASDGDYLKAKAEKCKKLFPHHVRCKVGFDNEESLKGKRYDCVETLMMFYRAHTDGPSGNYQVFYIAGTRQQRLLSDRQSRATVS